MTEDEDGSAAGPNCVREPRKEPREARLGH